MTQISTVDGENLPPLSIYYGLPLPAEKILL
jgi:hypothetical protein